MSEDPKKLKEEIKYLKAQVCKLKEKIRSMEKTGNKSWMPDRRER